jgi:predicted GTPase
MGYGRKQMQDLRATIEACEAELVLIGTPIDLRRLIDIRVPALRITYRLQEMGEPTLGHVLQEHGLIGDLAPLAGGASRPAEPASGPASPR